ncbi:MAG: hypothetical protein CME59_05725 [Halioglobus sp.]|nr:hypothetical protein [Halioglobus sp.]
MPGGLVEHEDIRAAVDVDPRIVGLAVGDQRAIGMHLVRGQVGALQAALALSGGGAPVHGLGAGAGQQYRQ